jgi:hypothetical protein
MPRVTPNRTGHGRHDVAFRGTRADPFAIPPAVEKANRRRKRKLVNRARRLLADPDLLAAARGLVAVKRRWVTIGSAGREYDAKLERSFARVYDEFRARWAAQARVGARKAHTESGGPGLGRDAPTAGPGTELPDVLEPQIGAAGTAPHGTEPSQGAPILPSQAQLRLGAGRRAHKALSDSAAPPLCECGARAVTLTARPVTPSGATEPSQAAGNVCVTRPVEDAGVRPRRRARRGAAPAPGDAKRCPTRGAPPVEGLERSGSPIHAGAAVGVTVKRQQLDDADGLLTVKKGALDEAPVHSYSSGASPTTPAGRRNSAQGATNEKGRVADSARADVCFSERSEAAVCVRPQVGDRKGARRYASARAAFSFTGHRARAAFSFRAEGPSRAGAPTTTARRSCIPARAA